MVLIQEIVETCLMIVNNNAVFRKKTRRQYTYIQYILLMEELALDKATLYVIRPQSYLNLFTEQFTPIVKYIKCHGNK